MASDIWRGAVSIGRLRCSELVLLSLVSCLASVGSHAASDGTIRIGPSSDFSRHSLVQPKVFHGRNKREITDTRENDHLHTDILTVGFEVDGVERILDLRLNTDLIPVGYKQRTQYNGRFKTEVQDKVELCQYQGSVRGIPDSWVALSTCRGLQGVIFDGENMHHIHPETESLDSIHYLYKQSDLITNHTCGYEGTVHEAITPDLKYHRSTRSKRRVEAVRGPYNANRQSRFVELVFVIDKKGYTAMDENLDKVHHHCKDLANIINALFTPLNIFVALVGVEVWKESDEITLSTKGDATLSNFLRYRREMLVKEIPNDNAQLLTRVRFDDGVVGKALKGPICTYEFSGGVSMDHSEVIGLVAATIAHEMGHNFGMEHDSPDCVCPEERCIMAPSSGSVGPVYWSSCSLEYLALAFEHGMDYCLRNKPTNLFDSPICGNGFVESGEQCDCGLKKNCDNPCCNATTCMLHTNASCATGECCDLKTCRPKNAGTECRSAEHECDLPEFCTGQSEYCPKDVFKIDGEICSMGKAFCYQGTCRTHNDQCKLLWGPSGSSSDDRCYEMNNKGTKSGNCGYNRLESSYVKCNDENILCGMLHCKHLNERLEFGMESVAILSHSFLNNGGKIIACRTAIVDLGLNQVDPGLAPDGAKCAPGKMCVNQKCMPIADLRASTIGRSACPNNCGGNGVCNSLGHCHCHRGFRPPDCVQPGYGGSDDSGPVEDPNARIDFITALYVIFLGIMPIVGLITLGAWYKKNNPSRRGWKKEVIPTYVSSLVCFRFKNNVCASKSSKERSKSLLTRFTNIFTSKGQMGGSTVINNSKVFTITDTLPREKLQITRKNLVSTTNPEAINCSSNIAARGSLVVDSLAKSQQKLSKNIQGLTLRTDIGFQGLNESPNSASGLLTCPNDSVIYANISSNIPGVSVDFRTSNKNTEGALENVNGEINQSPRPYYDKKPPAPPAPAKHLKPKI